jgi:ABC-2 type transport system permease protein
MSGNRLRSMPNAVRTVAALTLREYFLAGGAKALPWAVLTRSVLEVVFLWTFSRYVAPDYDPRLAFMGAVAFAGVEPTISRMIEVIQPDREQGVLYRLHLGQLPIFAVMIARAWVFALEGLASALVAGSLTAIVLGAGTYLPVMLTMLPFLALLSASASCFGLGLAAFGLGRSMTPMIGYFATSVVLLTGGVVPNSAASGIGSVVGNVITLRHGLEAARHVFTGAGWLWPSAQELIVAAAWIALGAFIAAVQTRRNLAGGFEVYE